MVAGLTLAAIAIPEQLATARLVGLPPVSGFLAFAAGSFAFAAFGANRIMSVGADSTIAPIMASVLALIATSGDPHYAEMSAVLAFLVGLWLLAAGALGAGWLADLLSIPVATGFLAGISVHIIAGQIPDLLGLSAVSGDFPSRVSNIWRQLPDANPYAPAVGLSVLFGTLVADRCNKRIPAALVGLLVSGLAVWIFALQRHGLAVLGALPVAAPHLSFALPTDSELARLAPNAIIVALVCMVQTAAVMRSFATAADEQENLNRDFAAIGIGSIIAAAIGAFAVDSSPPRTAVVEQSGGHSQLASLVAVGVIAGVALLAAGAFAFLPVAALSGVLIFIGLRIFRLSDMLEIYRRGGYEILLVAASAALVVLLPIHTGVTMSILLSLAHSLYVIARPDCAVLSRVPGTTVWWKEPEGETGETEPGILVFAPAAPILFTNAAYIRRRLEASIAQMAEPCRLVVIEASGVIDIDFTGSQALQDLIGDLRRRDIQVALARLESVRAQRAAEQTGLSAVIGAAHIFHSVEDAIRGERQATERA